VYIILFKLLMPDVIWGTRHVPPPLPLRRHAARTQLSAEIFNESLTLMKRCMLFLLS